jgi:hypothetical protein
MPPKNKATKLPADNVEASSREMAWQQRNHQLPRQWEIAWCLPSVERKCPQEWLKKSSSIKTETKCQKKTKTVRSPNKQET